MEKKKIREQVSYKERKKRSENLVDDKYIVRKIARDIGMPYEVALMIVRSSADYVAYVFEHSGFENVRLPYFGSFQALDSKIITMNAGSAIRRRRELNKKKNKDESV